MSENAVLAALRRMGFTDQAPVRSMTPSCTNRAGPLMVERQLAHGSQDSARAAYNFFQHPCPSNRRVMQHGPIIWSSAPVKGGRVVPCSGQVRWASRAES